MFVIVSEMGKGRQRLSGGRRGGGQRVFLFSKWRVRRPFITCLFEGGKLAWQTPARMR